MRAMRVYDALRPTGRSAGVYNPADIVDMRGRDQGPRFTGLSQCHDIVRLLKGTKRQQPRRCSSDYVHRSLAIRGRFKKERFHTAVLHDEYVVVEGSQRMKICD